MIICYHGTDIEMAKLIMENGFKIGTWFATHLENAIAFGGLHVFEVVFNDSKFNGEIGWQFHTLILILREQIISYKVYQIEKVFEDCRLRREIFDEELSSRAPYYI